VFPPRQRQQATATAAFSDLRPNDGAWRGERMSGAAAEPRHEGDAESSIVILGERPDGDSDDPAAQQASLPPLRWLMQPDALRFAHPAEVEFANLLSFYGIRWAYEPTTFAVRWKPDGAPEEFVTPDFYLPDVDAYVELTTMRQRLVTRKNRKFRLLRENYPNIRVRMLYRRDFERLRESYAAPLGAGELRLAATVAAAPEVDSRIADLAGALLDTWLARPPAEHGFRPLLLGLGAGSMRFLGVLVENLQMHGAAFESCRVDVTRYPGPTQSPRARVTRPPATSVLGRPVVVLQEVLSTGLSAAFLEGWLRRHGAASVDVCALLDREAARIVDVPVLCRGFEAPDSPLGGFGLTRWGVYRDLPFIAEIETR
jgi:bifunctional protein TilS/HprT